MILIFKFLHLVNRVFDRYRSRYYASLYGNRVLLELPVSFGANTSITMPMANMAVRLKIGSGTRFRKNCFLLLDATGQLTIGRTVFFNNGCSISCLERVEIGDNTLFGEGVKLYDHNHIFNQAGRPVHEQGYTKGAIRIGSNCWIGSNCIILKGVEIGDNVIVGAGCLLTTSVPANTVVRMSAQLSTTELVLRQPPAGPVAGTN